MNLTYKFFLTLLSIVEVLLISILSLRVLSVFFSNLPTNSSRPPSRMFPLSVSMLSFALSLSEKHTNPNPLLSPLLSLSIFKLSNCPWGSNSFFNSSSPHSLGKFLTYKLLKGVSLPSLDFLSYLSTVNVFPLSSFSCYSSIALRTVFSS